MTDNCVSERATVIPFWNEQPPQTVSRFFMRLKNALFFKMYKIFIRVWMCRYISVNNAEEAQDAAAHLIIWHVLSRYVFLHLFRWRLLGVFFIH